MNFTLKFLSKIIDITKEVNVYFVTRHYKAKFNISEQHFSRYTQSFWSYFWVKMLKSGDSHALGPAFLLSL